MKLPVEGALSAVRVRVEETLPLPGTVTVNGVGGLTLTPTGAAPSQPAVRVTVEPNPSVEERMIAADCDALGLSETTAGEGCVTAEVIEKSGATGASTEGVPAIVTTISDE